MSNKSPFLRKNGESVTPQNKEVTDVQRNIEAYLGKLQKASEEGAEERDLLNVILEDISKGNHLAVAASIAVLNSVVDATRAATSIVIKKIDHIEDERISVVDGAVKMVMASLVNKGVMSEKDYQFAASQISHLNKMVAANEELEQEGLSEERIDQILSELSDKAYQMTVIEIGDIYGDSEK